MEAMRRTIELSGAELKSLALDVRSLKAIIETTTAAHKEMMEIILKPLAGRGFFSYGTPHPLATLMSSLGTWLLYGWILEAMTHLPVVHGLRAQTRRAA